MFRSETKSLKSVISFLTLGLLVGLSLPTRIAKADIITDIEELEKEKDPEKDKEKKVEKKKESDKEPALKKSDAADKDTIGGKKPSKNAAPPGATERPDPENQTLIPEPMEDATESLPPPKAVEMKPLRGKTKEQRKKAPIHLKSDGTTTYSQDKLTVILQKNVMITQDNLRLQSDEAKVQFLPKNSADSGVKTAILDGKVSIARYSSDPSERMNAKSDKATFDNVQQLVTLDGNARLWREGDLVKGERIVYDLTTGMIKIEKAQGVVQPDRMKK